MKISNWHYFEPVFEYRAILDAHESAWEGHVYFAYDLVANLKPKSIVELGTHYGTSFFSFCQAVKDKHVNANLWAVDSWKGDPHASFYGEDVYDVVNEVKNKYYSDINVHLLRMNFDEAIDSFADHSIDLLHIDGYHTYEAVKHDFDSWINKTSENGIIIFHDTSERINDFGVYKLWEEIKISYKTIEFYHYHGLGVLLKKTENFNTISSFQEIWQKYYPLKSEISAVMNNLEIVQKENIVKNSRIEKLNYENDLLNRFVQQSKLEIESIKTDHLKLDHLRELNILQLNETIKVKETEALDLMHSMEQKQNELSAIQAQMNLIYRSWSWKLTKPISWLGEGFKRLNFKKWEIRNTQNEIVLITYKFALNITRLINYIAPAQSEHLLKIFKSVNLIRKSELFDNAYYFQSYPEVKKHRIDPILHYLVYGAVEGRNPSVKFNTNLYTENNPDIKYLGINPLIHHILTRNKMGERVSNSSISGGTVTFTDICRSLSDSEINSLVIEVSEKIEFKTFVLAISHTNYLTCVGGVEIFMQDERMALVEKGVSYLQISPVKKQRILAGQIEKFSLSFIVDSHDFGFFYADDLIRLFSLLSTGYAITCQSIVLHHLMSWNLDAVKRIISILNPVKNIFWIHDFYTVCPQINLLRNDKVFCNAPEIESNSCLICHYGSIRRNNLPIIKDFFDSIKLTVLAPSQVALDLWAKQFPDKLADAHVIPHVDLVPNKSTPKKRISDKTMNVAFVGIPANHKGWKTWRKLVERYDKSKKYNFFHLGNEGGKFQEQFIKVNVSLKNRDEMINALWSNNIDLLFHWAIWPETFSYTLYEGIASNCFILTFKNSGNVAKYVYETGSGLVFEDEHQLFQFMDDSPRVRKEVEGYLLRNPVPFKIERNNLISIKHYS